jgi:hypothetical protein
MHAALVVIGMRLRLACIILGRGDEVRTGAAGIAIERGITTTRIATVPASIIIVVWHWIAGYI